MAPEVYKGEDYGFSVDIYSLGLVLYGVLNHGRVPFLPRYPEAISLSDREAALLKRISGEPIPALENVDPMLAKIVFKACAYEREKRYKSPAEMRFALEDYTRRMVIGFEPARSSWPREMCSYAEAMKPIKAIKPIKSAPTDPPAEPECKELSFADEEPNRIVRSLVIKAKRARAYGLRIANEIPKHDGLKLLAVIYGLFALILAVSGFMIAAR
jgi:serine/threonine-protein kinase